MIYTLNNLKSLHPLYGEQAIKLPTPEFYVVYTGSKIWEEETLLGYSMLLTYIKAQREAGSDLKTAIDGAVQRCLNKGYLTDFLRKHGGEVTGMLFKEITSEEFAEIRAEEAARLAREAAFADGEKQGITKGRKEGIGIMKSVLELKAKGMSADKIAENVGCELELVEEILR